VWNVANQDDINNNELKMPTSISSSQSSTASVQSADSEVRVGTSLCTF